MRTSNAFVLAGAIASTKTVAAAASLPRGVGPEFVKFYETPHTFACIGHPTIIIKPNQINDNSCDCPDGSDEPGTAACAHINTLSPAQPLPDSLTGSTNTTNVLPGFWCENKGHVGSYVPFAFVNDGVCDYEFCCDGSEEYAKVSGVKCENRCAAIGKEHKRIEEEKRRGKERAAKQRTSYISTAQSQRQALVARVEKLNEEVKALEAKSNELEKKYKEVERSERGKIVMPEGKGGKLGVLVGLAKTRVNELRDTLEKVSDERDELKDKVEELEEILTKFKEEYNPNFNDEGVKAAAKAWEDYAAKKADEKESELSDAEVQDVLREDSETSGVNWKDFTEGDDTSDTDILYTFEAYLPAPIKDFVHLKLNSLRVWLIENGMLADNPAGSGETRLVVAAREAAEAAERDLTTKKQDAAREQEDLDKNYGPHDIFRALKDKCVEIEVGEYDYEMCWLGSTTQKSKKGHGNTSMGNFVRMDTDFADDEERLDGKGLGKGQRMVLHYENGQGCWNGPNRRTDVWLGCAEKEEIWRVTEAEKCVYKMEVGTPAACDDVHDPTVQGKDEL